MASQESVNQQIQAYFADGKTPTDRQLREVAILIGHAQRTQRLLLIPETYRAQVSLLIQ
jgi:hypothetical protein